MDLPASFARGFQFVGDVHAGGVFRAIEPEMSAAEFATLYASIDTTHDQSLDEACHMLERRTTRAGASGVERGKLVQLQTRTDDVVEVDLLGQTISEEQLRGASCARREALGARHAPL